jgi:hypothetical protein
MMCTGAIIRPAANARLIASWGHLDVLIFTSYGVTAPFSALCESPKSSSQHTMPPLTTRPHFGALGRDQRACLMTILPVCGKKGVLLVVLTPTNSGRGWIVELQVCEDRDRV